jgi:hypothetical protein
LGTGCINAIYKYIKSLENVLQVKKGGEKYNVKSKQYKERGRKVRRYKMRRWYPVIYRQQPASKGR